MNYKALPLLLAIILHSIVFAQSPNSFKYQAVARDASGYPITNQEVGLQIKIFSDNGSGDEYIEEHYVTTNDFGLINLEIGNGQIIQGEMINIDWGNGDQYIEISIDPSGGSSFEFMGTSQILSVPMASYAAVAGNVVDTSITNELQKLVLSENNMLFLNPGLVNNQIGIDMNQFDQSIDIEQLKIKITQDSIYFEGELDHLDAAIQEEIIRAIEAEGNLEDLINQNTNLINQNSDQINQNTNLINQNAVQILSDSIYFQTLIDNLGSGNDDSLFFKTLIDNNTANILADSLLFKSLIDANTLAIQQEMTRAILAEAINATNISLNTASIQQLEQDLIADSAYLKGLIDQNANAITAEITRAISAELANSNNITQNTQDIAENTASIFADSTHFATLVAQIDFYLQEEITRATYRDEKMSDSIIYLYGKQISDSIHFQNQINGLSGGGLDPTLENGKIFVGNASNVASGVYMSGDAQMTNTGVMLINPDAITTNKIADGNVTNNKLSTSFITIADDNGQSGQINLGETFQIESLGATNANFDNGTNKLTISSTDNQILSVSGSQLNITSGNSVDLSAIVGQEGPVGPQGPAGNDGADGANGIDGANGVGVQSTVNNGNGTFTINYTDGSSFTSVDLTGPQGPQGPVGPQGAIGPSGNDGVTVLSTVNNGDGTFTISYSDGSSFTSVDLTGPQGTQGIQGPQGAQGVQGIQGPAGNDGTDGLDGVGVQSTVNNGDGSFTITYTNGSSFTSVDLTGPQGPQGPIGPQGAIGPQGNDGTGVQSTINNGDGTFTINYTDGSNFTTANFTGPQGIAGVDGTDGIDGVSINWYGSGFPAPSSPNLNDGYHNPVERKSYIWNGSAWITIAEDGIQGPQGPTGPQGPAGTSTRECPATGSWSQINEEFCIEVNENTADTWWNAAAYCGDQNAHLCSWQEWFYVCQKSGSGTINMTNDWEWTGEAQPGSPSSATVVGDGSCTDSDTDQMTNTNTFRCCFSR